MRFEPQKSSFGLEVDAPAGNRRLLQIIVLILAAFLVAAYFSLPGRPRPVIGPPKGEETSVSRVVRSMLPADALLSVRGSILAIYGRRIVLDTPEILGFRIPEEADIRTRTVFVKEGTRFFSYKPKSQIQFSRELQTFDRTRRAGEPPVPYLVSAIALSDLQVGDRVSVQGGGDIKEATTIEASSIVRYELRQ